MTFTARSDADSNKKLVYIAGKMTGEPGHGYAAFDEAKAALTRSYGDTVLFVTPVDINRHYGFDESALDSDISSDTYELLMRRDLEVIAQCDAIAFLENAYYSRGAARERAFAYSLNLPFYHVRYGRLFKEVIIGVHGFAGAGKDTLATIIENNSDLERRSFAQLVKSSLLALNPVVRDSALPSDSLRRERRVRELLEEAREIHAHRTVSATIEDSSLIHCYGCGARVQLERNGHDSMRFEHVLPADTELCYAACVLTDDGMKNALTNVSSLPFALPTGMPLHQEHFSPEYKKLVDDVQYSPNLEREWDYVKRRYTDVRALLQRLGTEAGRNVHGDTVWIDALLKNFPADGRTGFVIPDTRFENEAEAIKRRGGFIIKISRPDVGAANSHSSEAGIDEKYIDAYITNSSTLLGLERSAAHVLDDVYLRTGLSDEIAHQEIF